MFGFFAGACACAAGAAADTAAKRLAIKVKDGFFMGTPVIEIG
jgi:hypothetical protein